MPKNKTWFWVAAFAAALIFDFLFWKKPFGISFCLWTTSLLIFGYVLAIKEGKKPARVSILLTVLVLAFSFVPAWRVEPMTRFVSVVLTLLGLLLLSATFTNGNWPFYRMWDYFKNLFIALGGGLSRGFTFNSSKAVPPELNKATAPKPRGKKFWAIVRGVLIAFPVVAFLALMLTAADPVFGNWLSQVLNLDKLPEYLFRLFYVLLIGMFVLGVYLHAIYPNRNEERPDPQMAWMKPFLGWTETAIILAAVDVLFIAFVFIQVRYFFGGSANISETGYTYAEYARKGFGELVAVAVISLGLYLCLNTVTKIEHKSAKIGFTLLSELLMALVLVILTSSFQRLWLYEDAYGFSQLRTYTHVFIFILAGLIVVTMLLELFNKRGHFALALLLAMVSFGAALAIMNVSGFVATKNIARAEAGEELDVPHLASLKADAVSVMFEKFNAAGTSPALKDDLGYALACQKKMMDDQTLVPWPGFNLSSARAWNLYVENQAAMSKYKILSGNGWHYLINGEPVYCFDTFMD